MDTDSEVVVTSSEAPEVQPPVTESTKKSPDNYTSRESHMQNKKQTDETLEMARAQLDLMLRYKLLQGPASRSLRKGPRPEQPAEGMRLIQSEAVSEAEAMTEPKPRRADTEECIPLWWKDMKKNVERKKSGAKASSSLAPSSSDGSAARSALGVMPLALVALEAKPVHDSSQYAERTVTTRTATSNSMLATTTTNMTPRVIQARSGSARSSSTVLAREVSRGSDWNHASSRRSASRGAFSPLRPASARPVAALQAASFATGAASSTQVPQAGVAAREVPAQQAPRAPSVGAPARRGPLDRLRRLIGAATSN
jgi:hypothetical protein